MANEQEQGTISGSVLDRDEQAQELDNPIWNALRTEHRSIAVEAGQASRYPAAIGPLGGMADQSRASYEDLRTVTGPGAVVALFLEEPAKLPAGSADSADSAGWTILREALLDQMVLQDIYSQAFEAPILDPTIRQLTAEDIPAMLELTALTEPGPFYQQTIELGVFYGSFEGDQLMAMAGQRMHLPQYVEVSAVCTRPEARGQGLARLLMSRVIQEILARGKRPILHTYSANESAIRVYRDLGFALRRTLHLAVLRSDG